MTEFEDQAAGVADRARERIKELEAALQEISKGRGPFSRDPLEHAANTIDSMKATAIAALERKTDSQ